MTPKGKPAPAARPCAGTYQTYQKKQSYNTAHNASGQDWRGLCAEIDLVKYGHVPVDGKIHGVGTAAHPNSKNGRVLRRRDGSGWAWNHETGERRDWRSGRAFEQTSPDFHRRKQTVESARRVWEAEQLRRYTDAAEQAARVWAAASPANPKHPYLLAKQVGVYGIRESRERLIVPIYDASGRLQSLQFIGTDGKKRFLSAGKITGGRFQIGDVTDPAGIIIVCEGYATGSTLHYETGYTVYAAFSVSNIENVAVSLRARFPKTKIVIAADNDHATEAKTGRNPGVELARKAAAACGGRLMVPPALPGCTDWNDIIQYERGGLHERHPE